MTVQSFVSKWIIIVICNFKLAQIMNNTGSVGTNSWLQRLTYTVYYKDVKQFPEEPTYDVGNPAPCFRQAQNWGGVKLINVIIILPAYNSISITGYNENRVFSYFLLQSAVFCTSLFVPLPIFFWQLCLSSVYGFLNTRGVDTVKISTLSNHKPGILNNYIRIIFWYLAPWKFKVQM
jgi:hypothetical protein